MLFDPVLLAGLHFPNRIVMAPMTRASTQDGVPGEANAQYYGRRAAGGAGLVVTEGAWIDHPVAGNLRNVPRMHGDDALDGWKKVVSAVHAEGSLIFPQLWHVGMARDPKVVEATGKLSASPSGHQVDGVPQSVAMTQRDIDDVIDAYASAAKHAQSAGFDGVELHGAHGYLIDSFFWQGTNARSDAYGGSLVRRTRFACEIAREIKRRTGSAFPLGIRISQWKSQDYSARLASSAAEWQQFLEPLVEAGVDIFHVSTRRHGDAAFEGSDDTLSALTRKITGRTVIAVGSFGLTKAKEPGWETGDSWSIEPERSLEDIERRLARGDFDLVALGRVFLANPDWGTLAREGRLDAVKPYTLEARQRFY